MAIDVVTYRGLLVGDSDNLYPQAGVPPAQPEVQMAVERFRGLPAGYRDEHVLLWWLLGESTQVFKMSKPDADYREKTPVRGQTCDNCIFAFKRVVDGKYICSQMRGFIKPKAWCRLWDGL